MNEFFFFIGFENIEVFTSYIFLSHGYAKYFPNSSRFGVFSPATGAIFFTAEMPGFLTIGIKIHRHFNCSSQLFRQGSEKAQA